MYKLLPKEYKRDLEFESILSVIVKAVDTSKLICFTRNKEIFNLPESLSHLKRIKKHDQGQTIFLLCTHEVNNNKRVIAKKFTNIQA